MSRPVCRRSLLKSRDRDAIVTVGMAEAMVAEDRGAVAQEAEAAAKVEPKSRRPREAGTSEHPSPRWGEGPERKRGG